MRIEKNNIYSPFVSRGNLKKQDEIGSSAKNYKVCLAGLAR